MEYYVGLDVSHKQTSVCVVDGTGDLVWRGETDTHPKMIFRAVECWFEGLSLVGLETGSLTPWLARAATRHDDLLYACVTALLEALAAIEAQIAALDKQVRARVRVSEACWRLTSVPCVGPVTALAFAAAIEDPERFRRSRDVGAYLGLPAVAAMERRNPLRRRENANGLNKASHFGLNGSSRRDECVTIGCNETCA